MGREPSRCGELKATAGLRPQRPGARPGLGTWLARRWDESRFIAGSSLPRLGSGRGGPEPGLAWASW